MNKLCMQLFFKILILPFYVMFENYVFKAFIT